MPLRLVTADQRMAEGYAKLTAVIEGRPKVGKTTLVTTLPPESTLFVNIESGTLSIVHSFRGLQFDLDTFVDIMNIACLIGGVDHSVKDGDWYSASHYRDVYNSVAQTYGPDVASMRYVRTVFFDSISRATNLATVWAGQQPDATNKYGHKDTRAIYGMIGREMVRLLHRIQQAPGRNIIFVGGLEVNTDSNGRETYSLQSDGKMTSDSLPFIVDEVMTLSDFHFDGTNWYHDLGRGPIRALCCKSPNPWGLPGGDRSGRLDLIEPPNLGFIFNKILSPRG